MMINILPLFFLSAWTISIVVNSSNSSTRRFPRTLDSTSRRSKNAGKCGFDYVNPNTFGWNALFRDNETPLFLCIFDRFLWNYLIKGLRPYKSYRIWKKIDLTEPTKTSIISSFVISLPKLILQARLIQVVCGVDTLNCWIPLSWLFRLNINLVRSCWSRHLFPDPVTSHQELLRGVCCYRFIIPLLPSFLM